MSSLREAAEPERITVKVRNMNRSASRDSPPPSGSTSSRGTKRGPSSGGNGRYDGGGGSSDERMTPDRMRRRVRSPSPRGPRGGYASPPSHRDEYSSRMAREPPMERGGSAYKVLCVSSLHHKASDEFIKETLYMQFKRFGDFSIRLAHDVDERVAYVCFRTADDARDAKHAKPRIVLYDKTAVVEPVIETARPPHGAIDAYKYKARSRTPPPDAYDRGGGGGGGGYGGYAPPPGDRGGRGRPPMDPYGVVGGGYGGMPPVGALGGHHMGGVHGGPPPPHHGGMPSMHHHHGGHPRDFRAMPMHDPHAAHHHGGGGGGGGYMAQPRGPPMGHHGAPPPLHHGHMGGGGGHMGAGGHPSAMGGGPPMHQSGYGPRHAMMPRGGNGGSAGGASGGGGGGGSASSSTASGPHENKKDKFPNYLHHVQPEDDPMATRTLFAGNLEINISEEELRRIFGKYGVCEDIDIKRPPPGTGNAFAFVRFQNLDMAHRAKVELSGQYIGKFQCKIGYGKSTPSTKIWIGGLGAWTSITQLEREFDRYGSIKKVDYAKGDSCATITYETIEAATSAVKEMRGFELGGPDRRLRIDFIDNNASGGAAGGGGGGAAKAKLGPPGYDGEPGGAPGGGQGGDYGGGRGEYGGSDYGARGGAYDGAYAARGGYRGGAPESSGYRGGRGGPPPNGPPPSAAGYGGRPGYGGGAGAPGPLIESAHRPPGGAHADGGGDGGDWRRPPADLEYEPNHRAGRQGRSGSREPGVDRARSRSNHRRSPDSDSDATAFRRGGGAGAAAAAGGGAGGAAGVGAAAAGGSSLAAARTLPDVARKCTKLWTGALILKSSLFPAKFHMTDGDQEIVDGLMRDEDGKHHLRITQRLRLDQPKLEDVQKRIASSSAHAIFLGLAGSTSSVHIDDANVQTRPLRNLVSYLKQKEAAGVISLLNKETEATGVLYAFPPCEFSAELLKRTATGVTEEALKEDHLVIVVVRGGTA